MLKQVEQQENYEYETKLGKLPILTDKPTHYCAGCEHGTLTRLMANALNNLQLREKCVMVDSVGCSVFAHDYINVDAIQAPHGRAPAVMSGIKRVRPDLVVFSVQGDGDAVSIGLLELMYAANRGEPLTVFLVNNAIYGMTGGQMAPTTPEGMVTTTSPFGRDAKYTGPAIDASKLLAGLERTAYVRRILLPITPLPRSSMYSARGSIEGARVVENAFRVQLMGGFSFVEVLSTCSVNWKMSILDSKKYASEVLAKLYPPGVYKDKFGVEGKKALK
ncbi:MAG TPA: thiamine pyrophosphate-dependent enzyme [Nitrososphaerales archaeon]|nr:thiamine pyrophosphate-dependent enzyme [Nitrososphaerales archaeon]